MAAEVYYQAIGTLQSHSYLNNLNNHQKHQNNLVRLVARDFISSNGLSTRRSNRSGQRNCCVIQSLASQTSVVDPVLSPSRSNIGDTHKKSSKINAHVNYTYCWMTFFAKCVHVYCFLEVGFTKFEVVATFRQFKLSVGCYLTVVQYVLTQMKLL